MKNVNKRPRLLIAAPQSGSGKTTIVSGLLDVLRKRGLCVQSFKIGPDYIDCGYHEAAGGRAAHNLDSWLMDSDTLLSLFVKNSRNADISIVEGVMGLYDGGKGGVSSTSQISKLLKIPVVLVIDAKSMGESAAAVAKGFRDYDCVTDIRGIILNRLGSESHKEMICQAMRGIDMPVLGALFSDENLRLPQRHLGLLPSEENSCSEIMEKIGAAIENSLDLDALLKIAESAPDMDISAKETAQKSSAKVRIGVARDEAFSFYYPESLAVLEHYGAEIIYFSPLRDAQLPPVSGLIFGGGFPEIFAAGLASNQAMLEAVRQAVKNEIPIYAECGGYMYLTKAIRDFNNRTHSLAGVINHMSVMNDKLQTVGYVEATALRDTVLCPAGTVIKGHEFHFSSIEGDAAEGRAAFRFRKNRTGEEYTAGYAFGNILASYLHLHFAGAAAMAEHFLAVCGKWAVKQDWSASLRV